MEFDLLASSSDKRKRDHVTITIRDEAKQAQTVRVSPQLLMYLWIVYLMSITFSILLDLASYVISVGEKSPREDDLGWFLLIMTVVAVSLTILSSAVLVSAGCSYMKSYMIRTSLVTIGSSSGILAHLSLGCFLIFPHINLDWVAYSVIGVMAVGVVAGYSFLWKHVLSQEENTQFNDDATFPWFIYLLLLPFLEIALLPFLPVLFMKLFGPLVAVEYYIYILVLHLLSKPKNVCNRKPSQAKECIRQRHQSSSSTYSQNVGQLA